MIVVFWGGGCHVPARAKLETAKNGRKPIILELDPDNYYYILGYHIGRKLLNDVLIEFTFTWANTDETDLRRLSSSVPR